MCAYDISQNNTAKTRSLSQTASRLFRQRIENRNLREGPAVAEKRMGLIQVARAEM